MNKFIKKFFNKLDYYNVFKFLTDKQYIELFYFLNFDKKIDLKNPKTYNEKIQWLKLYDRKPVYSIMVDKFKAKEYVANIIGDKYIIPTLGVWDDFDEINFSILPDKFVLKCTHDSGGVKIIKDKKAINYVELKKFFKKHLKCNYYYHGREWPYKNVKPRIIAEEYLEPDIDEELCDYKLFCFNGTFKLLLICSNRQEKVKFTFFDSDGKFLNIIQSDAENDSKVKLPNNFNRMICFAEKIAGETILSRIDFYEVHNKIYFGEITFSPVSGFGRFNPGEWDDIIGGYIKLPRRND